MRIGFAAPPPIGLAITVDDQRFDLIGVKDHVKLDGSIVQLFVWHSDCAECGVPFTTANSMARMPETRRCDAHRKPGKRVRKSK